MKEMKLISMVDFVLGQERELQSINSPTQRVRSYGRYLDLFVKYANFLKRPLEIWMFVPCDEDGNVLEEPRDWFNWNDLMNPHTQDKESISDCKQYEKAKERVLFEGFTEVSFFGKIIHLTHESDEGFNFTLCETINELVNYFSENIILTPTAIKEIGL